MLEMETTHRTAQDRINVTRDRISDLPDCVLLHTLSLLDDTKEVVKTSVLAKRWQYVWTSIPTLTFRQYNTKSLSKYHYRKHGRGFVKWVDQTLLSCQSTCIEKFKIDCDLRRPFARDVNRWFQYAVKKNVKDLTLCFPRFTYKLPCYVLSRSIVNLSLWGCYVVVPRGSLNWTSLKSLTIGRHTKNNDFGNLIASSPMLEYLKISQCCGGTHELEINSESLREFDIDYFTCRITNGTLKISAPRLESLRLLAPMFVEVQLLSVSSLLKVVLDIALYDEEHDESYMNQSRYINDLLGNLDRAVELELGLDSSLAMVLWYANPILSSRLLHLTCLKLKDYTPRASVPGIISILRSSPNLETLIIVNTGPKRRVKSMCPVFYMTLDDFWFQEGSVENHPLPQLKTVKFCCFENLGDADVYTRKLVELLQENAPLLGRTGVIMGQ